MLELLEGKNVFDPVDRVNGQYVLPLALAQYISMLGTPPQAMLEASPVASMFFDKEGRTYHLMRECRQSSLTSV